MRDFVNNKIAFCVTIHSELAGDINTGEVKNLGPWYGTSRVKVNFRMGLR